MEIYYTRQSIKALAGMDKNTRKRITIGVDKLPIGDIKKLQGYSNTFRLRIGDYRVLFSIENDIITVQDILPRGEAYKR